MAIAFGQGQVSAATSLAARELRFLSRLRGEGGAGVHPRCRVFVGIDFPHPPRSCERVDLPRKRER
jgi:hypothetical protein